MSLSRYLKPVLCVVLLGAAVPAGAQSQNDQDNKWLDMKPFIPPIIPLPPNAHVAPGTVDLSRTYSDPTPIANPQAPPSHSGLRLTIPMR
jgi:hypothetical protein